MRVLGVAIALTLAACSPPAAQAPAPSVEAPADDGQPLHSATALVSSEMLVGRWGDNGDCTKDITFAADGAFRSYTGGSGRWSVAGDRLTMAGDGGTFVVQIQSVNEQQLIVGNPDGSFGISQRC